LTDIEQQTIRERLQGGDLPLNRFWAALQWRVSKRVAQPSLLGPDATTAWYYPAAEYLSDAAMYYALQPDQAVARWLRQVTLGIVRMPAYDWTGPAFRDHSEPYVGHLETAHLCWAVASVYDLAREVFPEAEREEIRQALQMGAELCGRWLQNNTHLANWRGIMTSGVVVVAAVLEDESTLNAYLPELRLCHQAFQPDGSYGESLQYGNYLAFALMLAYESLRRKYPQRAGELDVASYGRGMEWVVSSMFYAKPMTGWCDDPRPRAANFNDSAALFRPSGDLLLHLSARLTDDKRAGLARWLFDTYYLPVPQQGPHDLATFGMRNDWGFLTLPLLTYDRLPLAPEAAGLPLTASFSNGHAFVRDAWNGKTILAINGGGDSLNGPGHLHGDLNSFILVHNGERLLVDPGHSCYRNLIHGLESASQTHNTCTFLVEQELLGLQEDLAKSGLLEQKSVLPRRVIRSGVPGSPVDRGNRLLTPQKAGSVSIIGAEVSQAYGPPIRRFRRLWILAGSHALFVVDRIEADQPVRTVWNWLVNNRDGKTRYETQGNELTVTRNNSGLRLFHVGAARLAHPVYGFVHDAYHVEPGQLGEGTSGSGLLFRWTEPATALTRTVVHAIALDEAALISRWELHSESNSYTLRNSSQTWTLHLKSDDGGSVEVASDGKVIEHYSLTI